MGIQTVSLFSCRYLGACCFIVICFSTSPVFAQDSALEVSVDRRVELMSIVFRLSGAPEYSDGVLESYNRDIEKHFDTFRNHPVVRLARTLRGSRGVSFDAPMTLAVQLPESANLSFALPLHPRPKYLDGRWVAQEAREFLIQLEAFAEESRFDAFFESNRDRYERWLGRLERSLVDEIHTSWFQDFFGDQRSVEFHLVLSPSSRNNYGPRVLTSDGINRFYSILGIWETKQGEPVFDQATPIVIHEFTHSYVNPLVKANEEKLRQGGETLYAYIKEDMKALGYATWQQTVCEALVRTSVARYRQRFEGPQKLDEEIRIQERYGFFMVQDLADLFAEYEVSRHDYPTFGEFMPRIVAFFDTYEQSMGPWQMARLSFHPLLWNLLVGLCSGVSIGLAIYVFKRWRRDHRRSRSSK